MAETFTLLNGRPVNSLFKDDGTEVRVSFDTDQGTIELVCTPEGLWNLGSHMSQLGAHGMAVKGQAQGFQQIHVEEIAEAKAETPKDAGIVALGLKGTNGSVRHFGLSPETSATLRQQMEAAERQARDNRKKKSQ
ncbi:MAG: hypothetical protein Q7T08_09765 [Devosia sp.]|nr:hypothetical protein [Devosia sp.]